MATKTTKRIAVTPKTWRTLGDMKQAGQSYDDLLREIIQKANRAELAKKARDVEDVDEDKLIPLNSLNE